MDSNSFGGVKIIGYEHNWDDAADYPVQLVCVTFWIPLCAVS